VRSSAFACFVSALGVALTGCQPAPSVQLPAEASFTSSVWGSKGRLFRSASPEVEPDLDELQATAEGARAVLLALPENERGPILARALPLVRTPPLPKAATSPDASVEQVPAPAALPEEPDLLSTLRELSMVHGSRDLALAAFFLGSEPVARACRRLRLPPEHVDLVKLASKLKRRELHSLRYVREARTWATLYGLAWPVDRSWRLASGFGPRIHPILGSLLEHRGVDISVPIGTAVRAPSDGVVVRVRQGPVNGLWLELNHGDGVRTLYCHLSLVQVKPGQQVKAGELVALSGETGRVTGPHLHYQVKLSGAWVDPVRSRASLHPTAPPLVREPALPVALEQAAMR
jgi:murein DD-endopeptidase MepM/ murein hydrolase activator NlpD